MKDCYACNLSGPALLASLFPPVAGPRGKREQKVPRHLFAGSGYVVWAPTKSEARAKIKQEIGKLPAGFYLGKMI